MKIIRVKRKWLVNLLRKPLAHTRDFNKAKTSKLNYGPCPEHHSCWNTSLLGVLSGLFNVVVLIPKSLLKPSDRDIEGLPHICGRCKGVIVSVPAQIKGEIMWVHINPWMKDRPTLCDPLIVPPSVNL